MAWVSFGTFFSLAQPYLIILYPFWNRLAYKKGVVIAAALAIVLSFTAVFILLPADIITFSFLQMWRISMFGPAALFCFVFIGKDRAKVMYFFLIIATLFVACIKLANHIIWSYFDNANYIDFTIVHTVMHIITTPLLMAYINRLAKRTVLVVEPSGNRIWKIVWAVPTLFLMINVAFNLRFDPEVIVTQAFVISNILSIIGILVTSEILLRALQIVSEAAALKEEKAMLASLNRMKTEFLQDMSHEIKTPLAVISGYVQQAEEELEEMGIESEYINPVLEKAYTEAMRLGRLTENALRMAVLQESGGKMMLLDPAELFSVSAEGYRSYMKKQGNILNVNIAKDLPKIFGNADQLIQVLTNLLANAGKHTKNGEISVSAALVRDDESNEGAVSVTITDTGTGIDPELLPYIFGRNVSGSDGTGMGLAICKNIAESHGGAIDITSEMNKGTTVVFTVPLYNERKADGSNG